MFFLKKKKKKEHTQRVGRGFNLRNFCHANITKKCTNTKKYLILRKKINKSSFH